MKRFVLATFSALAATTFSISSAESIGYSEPSEIEMKQALMTAMEGRGGNRYGPDSIGVDNPIAGVEMEIEYFEKAGCRPANYGAGYFCTYVTTMSFRTHSNEGTAAGDAHADAVNQLLGALMGGRSVTDTVTRRFVKAGNTWYASEQ